MVETRESFASRLDFLGRKHARMTHGYVTKIGKDGLMVAVPKAAHKKSLIPLKFMLLVVIGLFCFKAFMLSAIGPVTYNARLATLENGTMIEQIGAKAMVIDPVTAFMADLAGPILR